MKHTIPHSAEGHTFTQQDWYHSASYAYLQEDK
jgi:hypothetical protein